MERSLCWLIVGKQEEPKVVLETLEMCLWMQQKYLQYCGEIGDIHHHTTEVLFCHPAITVPIFADRNAQVQIRSGWQDIARLRSTYPFFTIVGFPEHLAMPPLKQAISSAYAHIDQNEYEVTLLVSDNGCKTSLADLPIRLLHECVQHFYNEPELWLIVPEYREFAFVRRIAFRHIFDHAGYWTCRLAETKPPSLRELFRPRYAYVLNPKESSDVLNRKLDTLLFKLQEERMAGSEKIDFKKVDFLQIGPAVFELKLKSYDEYTFQDMIWMMYLEANIEGAGIKIIPQNW